MVFYIDLLLQTNVVLNQLLFIKRRLFDAEVVHNEEVACIRLVNTNIVDVVKVWTLTVDDIAEMIILVEDVIARVDEYF